MPKVSIVIPCYNHGEFLSEALDSIAAQTCLDYEVIIVDDGSTDSETIRILQNLDYTHVKVVSISNSGAPAARNRAIAEASSDYILPLDADDMLAPNYLEKALAVIESCPQVGVVYCDQMMFGEREGLLILPDYDPSRLLVQNLIHASALFRKEDWKLVGGYCEAMTSGWEDWEFWISISHLGREVVKLDGPYHFYRITSTSRDNTMSLSSKLAMFAKMVWRHRSLYLKNLPYVMKSLSAHILSPGHCSRT